MDFYVFLIVSILNLITFIVNYRNLQKTIIISISNMNS